MASRKQKLMFFAGFDGTSESVGFAKYNEDGFLINEKQLVPLKKNTFYEKQTSNPCLIKTNDEISKATGGFGIPGFKWPF